MESSENLSLLKPSKELTPGSAGTKSKDAKIKKNLTTAKSSYLEPKKASNAAVYEEVDIFASVRSQHIDKIGKRKRRKSVSSAYSKESTPPEISGAFYKYPNKTIWSNKVFSN